MNSKIYQKPSFSMAKIEMNDLCAGSKPVNLKIGLDRGAAVHQVRVEKEVKWDTEF